MSYREGEVNVMLPRAVIFHYDSLWLAHEPCFDCRFDAQILPSGVVVNGFMVLDDNGVVQELLQQPHCATAEIYKQWQDVVELCRKVVGGDEVEEGPSMATSEHAREVYLAQKAKKHPSTSGSEENKQIEEGKRRVQALLDELKESDATELEMRAKD